MNILLISRFNTDNLGDQAIHYSMKKMLLNFNANVYSADLRSSKAPSSYFFTKQELKHKSNSYKNIFFKLIHNSKIYDFLWKEKNHRLYNVLNKKIDFDFAFIGGGELIAPSNMFCYSIYSWVKKIKKKNKNTKIIIFSVGVNINLTKNDIYYLKKAFKHVTEIYVRDEKSYKNMLYLFNIKTKIIPDSVFSNEINICDKSDRNLILYGITDFKRIIKHSKIFNTRSEYYEYSFSEINRIQKKYKDKNLKLFYTTQNDVYECIDFIQYIKEKYNFCLSMVEVNNLKQLNEYLLKTYFCASPRMHGCILANLNNVNIVEPILISSKMNSYSKKYKNVNYNELKNQLYETMENLLNLKRRAGD